MTNGRLNALVVGLNVKDLAWDCIADLFNRDQDDSYVQLEAYFKGISLSDVPDWELLAHVRRLVCSKVNQNIFRIYNEIDPALGKICRNMKIAIQSLGNFTEVQWFGEPVIAPALCETLQHLEPYDPEELEMELGADLKGNERIPDLLAKLCRILRGQERFSRAVPLMQVAYIIRSIYSEENAPQIIRPEIELKLSVEDAARIGRRVCSEVKDQMRPRYVGKDKIEDRMYDKLFNVVELSIIEAITGTDGQDISYYERLKTLEPSLTHDHYKKYFKNILEYIARRTREKVIMELRNNEV